jgi:hypothetical protein
MNAGKIIEDEVDDRLDSALSETREVTLEVTQTVMTTIKIPVTAIEQELRDIIRKAIWSPEIMKDADTDVISACLMDDDGNELASVDY